MRKYFKISVSAFLSLVFFFFKQILGLIFNVDNIESTSWYNHTHILFTIAFAWFLVEIVHLGKKAYLAKFDLLQEDNLKSRKIYTQFNILEKVVIFIIITFALGIILVSFESVKKIGFGIFASAGVAGIIIGLSAQKIVGALLAGIQIAITQPFRIDDAVVVEGEWGWIEEINLTYVVVKIWDKRRLVLPSTYFLEKPFQNWTRTNAEIIGTVFLYTDYNIPFQKLRDELTRLLNDTPLWNGDVNVLQVTESKEHTVEIRILVSAKNSPTAWDLRVYIREKMIEYIQNNYPESLPKTRVLLQGEK